MAQDLSEVDIIHQELDKFSGNFYRNKFRRNVNFLILLLLCSAILAGILGYLVATKPKDPSHFYSSNTYNGNNTKLYPLSNPMFKSTKLLQWAQQAVIASYKFNFVNYHDAFSKLREFFTDTGWKDFQNMLQTTQILDTVINKKLFVTAQTVGQPTILSDGIVNGQYAWKVQVPVLLTYTLDSGAATAGQSQQTVKVTIIVMRIPDLDNPDEIAINNFAVS